MNTVYSSPSAALYVVPFALLILGVHSKGKMEEGWAMVHKELWVHILSFLDVKDVVLNTSLVCTTWHSLAESDLLWEHFCSKHEVPCTKLQLQLTDLTTWKRLFIHHGNISYCLSL